MNPILINPHSDPGLRDEGMLFVRTDGILQTMVKAPLIFVGLIVVAVTIPLQASFSSSRSLDLIIFPDGSTHVSSKYDIDPLDPETKIQLFGTAIDNFVAVDENGFLLTSTISGDVATIDTLGSESINIEYDTQDLVSKSGRIWTFSINSTDDYSLTLPKNSIIVGMSDIPQDMSLEDGQSKLVLQRGPIQIDYVFSTIPSTQSKEDLDPSIFVAAITIAIAGIVGIIYKKRKGSPQNVRKQSLPKESDNKIDIQKILENPDLREDDKEIVKFIFQSGGQALESDLRKKFLQPRTTMWRAVKRLERQGIIEIEKKDLQNLVKLKKNLEDDT